MQSKNIDLLRKLPRPVAAFARDSLVYPRYWWHALKCMRGYRQYGHLYKRNVLFVVGIPKSGTTWLEQMLGGYPGYSELLIPEASLGSDMFALPEDTFTRMRKMLVVMKMHLGATEHNVRVLRESEIAYPVLYRDVRDICISNYNYIRLTPWHFAHARTISQTLGEYIDTWMQGSMAGICRWIDDWERMRDPERSIMVRYEDILGNPCGTLRRILDLYDLPASDEQIEEMVKAKRFDHLSGGREAGKEQQGSFFRKGIAGDWKNHFTETQKQACKEVCGDWLIRHGYESDYDW